MSDSFIPRFALSSIALTIHCLMTIPSVAAEQDNEKALERIEVTAQKRVQDIQTVPVSVTAISGQALTANVIKDVFDLETRVAGFSAFQSQSATNSSFGIRGISTSSQNYGFESSVGLYIDDVYRSRQNAMISNFLDIQSVEILRGPQGTLFGKNTPSGAVTFTSVKPEHGDRNGFVNLTLGNYQLINASFGQTFTPIEDVLSVRFSGLLAQRDGFIDDSGFGSNAINDRDRQMAKAHIRFTPSDDVEMRLIADYATLDEACCGALTFLGNTQALEVPGKFGTDALLSSPLFGATIFDGSQFNDYETAVSFLPRSQMTDKGVSFHADWQLNKALSFTSITALRAFDARDDVDTDFSNANLLSATNDAEQSSFSQEFRWFYESENFSTLAGLFYFQQSLDLDFSIGIQDQFPLFFAAGATELQPLLEGINQLRALTGGLIAPAGQATPGGSTFPHRAEQDHKSYAAFAQIDYALNEQWTLTAGLRYTNESKDLFSRYDEQGPGIDGLPSALNELPNPVAAGQALGNIAISLGQGGFPAAQDLAAIAPFQRNGWGYFFLGTASVLPRPDTDVRLDDDRLTGTLKLSYQANRDQLIYTSVSTGYKSGGTNTDRIAPSLDPLFDAETSTAFELGLKQDFPQYNMRLNAAIHYTTIDDYQATTFTGTGFNLQNAGSIDTYGGELEFWWQINDAWELHLNVAHVRAEFDSFLRGTCWTAYTWHTDLDDPGRQNPTDPFCDRSGDRKGFEPENTGAVQLSYAFDLTDDIYSELSIDYQFVGDSLLNDTNDPFTALPSYELVNVRWLNTIEKWDTDIVVWARNLLDERYVAKNGADVPVQPGKLIAYPGEPVTFGVSINKRF